MTTYKLQKTLSGEDVINAVFADGSQASFLCDPANTDYQVYLKWLEEGNTPLPADEVTPE